VVLLYADPKTLTASINQTDIANTSGCSLRTVKKHLTRLRDMQLLRTWRGPEGRNFYRINLPLPADVVRTIQSRIPHFGIEPVQPRKREKTRAAKIPGEGSAAPERNAGSDPQCHSSSVDTNLGTTGLDPQISAALDDLECRGSWNTVARFLSYIGLAGPKLASDQGIKADRQALFNYLEERNANSITRLGELVEDFAASSADFQPPCIDLPMSEPFSIHIHRKLSHYPLGEQWLRKTVDTKDPDGVLLPERQVRVKLYDFMKQNGLHTLEDVIGLAIQKHNEAVNTPKAGQATPGTRVFDLLPGEMTCDAIMTKLVDDDPSWSAEVVVTEDEMGLFGHCQAKYDREHAHIRTTLTKVRQRHTVVNALVIVGRQHPELVGYSPDR